MTVPPYLVLEPIDPIDGDPTEIRQFAHDLRRLTGGLDVPRRAAVSLQAVRHASVWDGDVFLAFLTLIEKLPKPSDIDNAVDRFHWLASELETFADVLDECQAENRRSRRDLDDAHPPDVELTDDVLSTMHGISLQASQTLERLDEASTRLRNAFDDMDRLTNYAEPPPSRLERIGNGLEAFKKWSDRVQSEFVIGIGVGAWEMVKGLGMLAYYTNPMMLPITGPKLWKNRETVKAIATFARHNPRLFATEMGKAVVDWETLDKSPARWLGKKVPDLLLVLATSGSGSIAADTAEGTVGALRLADGAADASEDLSAAARVLNGGSALVRKSRIALHDGVTTVDGLIDPALERTGVRMLRPKTLLTQYGINQKPTQVKNLVTGGWYSRMKLADHYVNGLPGLTSSERVYFLGSRAMSSSSTFTDRQQIYARSDALASTEPAGSPPPSGSPPPPPPATSGPAAAGPSSSTSLPPAASPSPTTPAPAPAPRPDVLDPAPAPAPPPRQYQTTSSAGPP